MILKKEIVIRNEANADFDAITRVTVEAFKTLAISDHTEQFIIEALRDAGALSMSLVADKDGWHVIGPIAFSPVTISDGTAVSHQPEHAALPLRNKVKKEKDG